MFRGLFCACWVQGSWRSSRGPLERWVKLKASQNRDGSQLKSKKWKVQKSRFSQTMSSVTAVLYSAPSSLTCDKWTSVKACQSQTDTDAKDFDFRRFSGKTSEKQINVALVV